MLGMHVVSVRVAQYRDTLFQHPRLAKGFSASISRLKIIVPTVETPTGNIPIRQRSCTDRVTTGEANYMTQWDIVARLGCAVLAGSLLGMDREIRGIQAGLRTHALVALSAAAITVSALLLHDALDADGRTRTDPLRVVQGLAQAIGFISAGVIFVARDRVLNVTSAVNVWLAAAMGIAAGAGQYFLLLVSTGLGLFILVAVRAIELLFPGKRDIKDD